MEGDRIKGEVGWRGELVCLEESAGLGLAFIASESTPGILRTPAEKHIGKTRRLAEQPRAHGVPCRQPIGQ